MIGLWYIRYIKGEAKEFEAPNIDFQHCSYLYKELNLWVDYIFMYLYDYYEG